VERVVSPPLGEKYFEGIIVNSRIVLFLIAIVMCSSPASAAAVLEDIHPWPKGVVYYSFEPSLVAGIGNGKSGCAGWRAWPQARSRAALACRAMSEWEAAAGVKFLHRAQPMKDTLTIKAGLATRASMGYRPNGSFVSIKDGASLGDLLHEFGHVLGLIHEHQRPDRDGYIRISPHVEDITKKCVMSAVCYSLIMSYPKMPNHKMLASIYDPCSIMHYGPSELSAQDSRLSEVFSLTAVGRDRLKACAVQFARRQSVCRQPGQRCGISTLDAVIVRRFNDGTRPR
jgi:hypothetical protein